MRISFVEWPEALAADGEAWAALSAAVAQAAPDILVTNEMPFGAWIAEADGFADGPAEASLAAHAAGLAALARLGVPAVISSRPVRYRDRLANEAFVLEAGAARPLHRKQCFPDEPGWREAEWYLPDSSGFALGEAAGIKVGALLCTEVMFNERARAYGRAGASLIVVPRASGETMESWRTACAMAALVSGAYVVSSNRVGQGPGGVRFGGVGMAYAPGGRRLAETSRDAALQTIDFDPEAVAAAQRDYPCYVAEPLTPRPRRPARPRRLREP